MTFPLHKFTPGPCRVCGARPRVRGQWVACTDPMCHMSRHPITVQCWPRARVVDWQATLLAGGMVAAGAFCLVLIIGCAWYLMGAMGP